ncbi:MAG: glycosyltransferase [Pseudomonadota bacterium]
MASDLSIIVTSYNRAVVLRRTLMRLVAEAPEADLIVCDDGSTDGTLDMLAWDFPGARVLSNTTGRPRGVVAQRHLGYLAAHGRYALSIDDDLRLGRSGTIAWLRSHFDMPGVAVVAVPFVDVLCDAKVQNASPSTAAPAERHAHIGAGAMIDLNAYHDVGGYGLWIEGYREEADLALRLMDGGYRVIAPPATFIAQHMRLPGGLSAKARHRSARNDVLFYWRYTPGWRWMPFVCATILRNLRDAMTEGAPRARLTGLAAAWPHARRMGLTRRPVRQDAFLRFRHLKSAGPVPTEVAP